MTEGLSNVQPLRLGIAELLLAFVLILPIGSGCVPSQRQQVLPPREPMATLLLKCATLGGMVFIDGKLHGKIVSARAEENAYLLPEGFHRIEVRRFGFHSFYGEVTLVRNKTVTLVAILQKELD